jgi:hypothetical protein
MRIEELIRQNGISGLIGSEYIIKVVEEKDGQLFVTVRPLKIDGEVRNYVVKDNILYPIE